jgi:exopolysaccharide biosynthesis polyprenyl glycosylphosphotransferase
MGSSNKDTQKYLPPAPVRRRQRGGIRAGKRPDVLHEIYALVRNVPPLLAAILGWTQVHWRGVASFSGLEMRSFTIRHMVVLLLMMWLWIQCFKGETIGQRTTPFLVFIYSQVKAVFIGTLGCSMLLWVGRVMSNTGKHMSILMFAARCMVGGLVCVLAGAVLYEIVNRFSSPKLYLIVGSRRRAIEGYKQLLGYGTPPGAVLGFIDPDNSHSQYLPGEYLGSMDRLEELLMRNPIDLVYLALPLRSQYTTVQEAIWTCERMGVEYALPVDIFESNVDRVWRPTMQDAKAFVCRMVLEDYRMLLKRILDVSLAIVLLFALAPLMAVIAIAIKLTSPGPVLFVQERLGRNRHRFRMYKFRSMVRNAEELFAHVEHRNELSGPVFKMKRDPRVTKIGTILRKLSLDELPQLFNVIKGDMSLVGPRPMSLRDVSHLSEAWLMRRFSVTPGMTGLWQVSGRSNTNFDTWIKLDLQYIDKWSLALDFKILLRTIPMVISGTGAA